MTQEFIFNMVLILAVAIVVLVGGLAIQQYTFAKDYNWPHPLLKTPHGMHVVANNNMLQTFEAISLSIANCQSEEQLRATYNLIDDFNKTFPKNIKEYDELLVQYCNKSPMISIVV